ncbi:MAG: Hsp33 family molecular chaperone HslO [Deltaproteobacteria bacterium]|nr:Hsp33 family molecular chaperone HslO [Deltaproteobacteria bacterium]
MADRLLRGLYPELGIRFAVTQAAGVCNEAATRHRPDHLAGWLLGEALTVAVVMSVNLKGEEKYTLRWLYDGPAGQLLADVTTGGRVRGFVQKLNLLEEGLETIGAALGQGGRVAAVSSLPEKVLHTGITSAVFQNVPQDMAHLLSLSFQVESALAVGLILPIPAGSSRPDAPEGHNGLGLRFESALGILLQAMPGADHERFGKLRATIESPGFTTWLEEAPRDCLEVLEKAGGGEAFQVLEEGAPEFFCGCSREKVENVLHMMEHEEIQSRLLEENRLRVQCHFCGESYEFTPDDLAILNIGGDAGHG